MHPVSALRFAHVARVLGAAARAGGLRVPAFRSPPRIAGARRTVRRYPGGAVVAVRLQGRSLDEVVADMVEGVVVANSLGGDTAARVRRLLVGALDADPVLPTTGRAGPAAA
ncbi:MAG: hypothetical protein U0V73_00325 [Acidimicrobiia bacterium]